MAHSVHKLVEMEKRAVGVAPYAVRHFSLQTKF